MITLFRTQAFRNLVLRDYVGALGGDDLAARAPRLSDAVSCPRNDRAAASLGPVFLPLGHALNPVDYVPSAGALSKSPTRHRSCRSASSRC